MTIVVRTGQGKPGTAKTIQGHDQGCQSQLDKSELDKARHDEDHTRGRMGPGPDRPTELGHLRLEIDQRKSNQSSRGQAQ